MRALTALFLFICIFSLLPIVEAKGGSHGTGNGEKMKREEQKLPNKAMTTKNNAKMVNQSGEKEAGKSPKSAAAEKRDEVKTPENIKPAASRILVALAPDSKSHLRSMLPLINRLASVGHHVHLFHVSSEEKDEKFNGNVSLIRVKLPAIKDDKVVAQLGERIWHSTLHSPGLIAVYMLFASNFSQFMDQCVDKVVNDVLNEQWDLMIVGELFSPHAYAFAEMLHQRKGVPYVMFSPAMMMSANAYAMALGNNWVTHPHPFSPTPTHAHDAYRPGNVLHRIVNVLETAGDLIGHFAIDVALAPRLSMLTGKADFKFSRLFANSEMSIVDSIAYLAFPQTESIDVLNAGAHCELSSILPDDYRTFVEDPASKGTVYVAFGTFIPWDYAPPHVATAFFDAFEMLSDYRFIFSYRGKFPTRKLSPHIRLVSWAPQLDILAHPKTRVFLTHCGLKSIKESLCTKTPMLAMPMFAEQNHNARLVIEMGIGLALNKYDIQKEQLYSALKELLEMPKYSERVEKMQAIFMDRPMDALDQSEYRIRQIIAKGPQRMGRHFFKREALHRTTLEYFQLDWAILLVLIIFSVSK